MIDNQIKEMTIRIFKKKIFLFFGIISYSDILSSLILKILFDTICIFFFNMNGRRAIIIFKFTITALNALALNDCFKNEELSPISLIISFTMLQRIVNLNQNAQIIMNFTPIIDTISVCIPEQLPL
jgi:hypothetical protein